MNEHLRLEPTISETHLTAIRHDLPVLLGRLENLLERMEANQRKELENIRFNTGYTFYMTVVLVAFAAGAAIF